MKEQKDDIKQEETALKKNYVGDVLDVTNLMKLKKNYGTALVGIAARATLEAHWSPGIHTTTFQRPTSGDAHI